MKENSLIYLRSWLSIVLVCLFALNGSKIVDAREIHVAKFGKAERDNAAGTAEDPYLTINQAASVALPGDVIIVHEGIYREYVKPPRGGISEDNRIIYRAAAGEEVFIKGSERITSWEKQDNGVWKVTLPNSFFGSYNPYALNLSGGWLNYGQWHHRGDVYLNGEAYIEMCSVEATTQSSQSWCCMVDENETFIFANFGPINPNEAITEINVRESLFMPEESGLKYITIDGFHFEHAAANWAPPVVELQMGAVGPRMGKNWIIENCTITNARCVGIILGQAPGIDYSDIDAFGDHIIRNNIIRRCGQAGIAGQKGATRSLISGNLIEETNYRKEFGGWETAALKFHNSVDLVIENNLIRGVYHIQQGAYGIWIDFGNQGTRISGNVVYNTEAEPLFLEMNHGPTLVDNNVLVGHQVLHNSEATIFAHNLFVDVGNFFRPDSGRQSGYFVPHTTKQAGSRNGAIAQDDKWFNNIFIRKGLDNVKNASGYVSEFNVFLEGAKKSSFGDKNSVVDMFVTGFTIKEEPLGVSITFNSNDEPLDIKAPLVGAKLVGVLTTTGQTIEDRFRNPIIVNTDINGKKFTRPVPGPLSNLTEGLNTIKWSYRRSR